MLSQPTPRHAVLEIEARSLAEAKLSLKSGRSGSMYVTKQKNTDIQAQRDRPELELGDILRANQLVRARLARFISDRFEKAAYDAEQYADEVVLELLRALGDAVSKEAPQRPRSL